MSPTSYRTAPLRDIIFLALYYYSTQHKQSQYITQKNCKLIFYFLLTILDSHDTIATSKRKRGCYHALQNKRHDPVCRFCCNFMRFFYYRHPGRRHSLHSGRFGNPPMRNYSWMQKKRDFRPGFYPARRGGASRIQRV